MKRMKSNLFPVWKPKALSSGDVVKTIKSKFNFNKVGHCGTLDPFAEGILLIVTGEETSNSIKYMSETKTYRTVISLGQQTDTLDNTGVPIKSYKVNDTNFTKDYFENILSSFEGAIMQRPPAFSAKKINGIRLYKLARQDVFVHLKPVKIFIEKINFVNYADHELTIEVICEKGTYIRQLGLDIAKSIGTVGHLKSLVRTKVGTYVYENSLSLEDIENWNY